MKRIISALSISFLFLFVTFSFFKTWDVYACSTNGTCFTGTQGADLAPGYLCGTKDGYVYESDAVEGGNSNNPAPCFDNGSNGYCCAPGTPKPPLPSHNGYDLGGNCSADSVCYTGDYKNPINPGDNCGGLTGWHAGNDGSGNVPFCAIGGHICCDDNSKSSLNTTPPVTPFQICPQDNGVCQSFNTALGNINVSGPGGFVRTLFGLLLSLSGGIALILIIFSGYRIMTAQGDPEKVKAAREMLTAAIIGLLFTIFSLTILQILGVDILKIPGFN